MIFSNFMFLFENFKSLTPLKIKKIALMHFLFLKVNNRLSLSLSDIEIIRWNNFINLFYSRLN